MPILIPGVTDEQASTMVKGLAVTGDEKSAVQQIKNLYSMFVKTDCTMAEVRRCWGVYLIAGEMDCGEGR